MNRIFDGSGHLNIRVKDMNRAMEFYVSKLGFEPMFRTYDSKNNLLQYLRMGPGRYLELYDASKGEVKQFPDQQSFKHFCLHVKNLEETAKELIKRGLDLYIDTETKKKYEISEGPYTGRCKSKIAWLIDPDGNRIELMELTKDSLQTIFEQENPWK